MYVDVSSMRKCDEKRVQNSRVRVCTRKEEGRKEGRKEGREEGGRRMKEEG